MEWGEESLAPRPKSLPPPLPKSVQPGGVRYTLKYSFPNLFGLAAPLTSWAFGCCCPKELHHVRRQGFHEDSAAPGGATAHSLGTAALKDPQLALVSQVIQSDSGHPTEGRDSPLQCFSSSLGQPWSFLTACLEFLEDGRFNRGTYKHPWKVVFWAGQCGASILQEKAPRRQAESLSF